MYLKTLQRVYRGKITFNSSRILSCRFSDIERKIIINLYWRVYKGFLAWTDSFDIVDFFFL